LEFESYPEVTTRSSRIPGGDPTAAADDQKVQVGIQIHCRDNRGFFMRVNTRRAEVEPIYEDQHSHERNSIAKDITIHSILGFLRGSGDDSFTSTATFGEIIWEVVTAQCNPKTIATDSSADDESVHQLGDTDHFADEWILLHTTCQMTDDLQMKTSMRKTKNQWKKKLKLYTVVAAVPLSAEELVFSDDDICSEKTIEK
jgi:hypothetical protein